MKNKENKKSKILVCVLTIIGMYYLFSTNKESFEVYASAYKGELIYTKSIERHIPNEAASADVIIEDGLGTVNVNYTSTSGSSRPSTYKIGEFFVLNGKQYIIEIVGQFKNSSGDYRTVGKFDGVITAGRRQEKVSYPKFGEGVDTIRFEFYVYEVFDPTNPGSIDWNDIENKPSWLNQAYIDDIKDIANNALNIANSKWTYSESTIKNVKVNNSRFSDEADKLSSKQEISLTGDIETSFSFDGSDKVTSSANITNDAKKKLYTVPEFTVIRDKTFTVQFSGGDMENGVTIKGLSISNKNNITTITGKLSGNDSIQSNNTIVPFKVVPPPSSDPIDISF